MNYLVQLVVLYYMAIDFPWAQALRGQGTDGNWFVMDSSSWGFWFLQRMSFSHCHLLPFNVWCTFIKDVSLRNELATVMSKELWAVREKWAGRHGKQVRSTQDWWQPGRLRTASASRETEDGTSSLWPSACKVSDGFWPGHSAWATGEKFTIHEQTT